MFFLIRCVFWLTIVFHAMSWPQETPSAQAGGNLQDGMIKAATGVAGDLASAAGTLDRLHDFQSKIMKAIDSGSSERDVAGEKPLRSFSHPAPLKAKLEEGCLKVPADCVAAAAPLPQIVATAQAPARQAGDVVPPRRPLRLAESESGRPVTTHKALVQHN